MSLGKECGIKPNLYDPLVFLYKYDYRLYVGKVLPCFEKVIGF